MLYRYKKIVQSFFTDSLEFERFQRGLSARIPVLIATCVQIAAKSISAAMSLTATQVCNYLIRKGTKHSIRDIVTWEYHVFQTIGQLSYKYAAMIK